MKQKQSSSISAKTATEALLKIGYQTKAPDRDRIIRPTEKHLNRKNPGIEKSASGKSVLLYYTGNDDGIPRAAELFVPLKGMLSIEQVQTLQKLANITFSNLDH